MAKCQFKHTITAPDGTKFTATKDSPIEAEENCAAQMRAAGRDPAGTHEQEAVARTPIVVQRLRPFRRGRR